MSTRSFADGRKLIGKKTSAKGRLDAAVLAGVEPLEKRQMLNAQVNTTITIPSPAGTTPLPPQPGATFYVNGLGTTSNSTFNSAITPNTVNDLVLNVTAYSQNYQACCEGNGSNTIANPASGANSINAGRLLTNGLTQNQTGGFPATGAVASPGSGFNNDASSGNDVDSDTSTWFMEYNLGSAPGQVASNNGYDLSEIDVIAGSQDSRTSIGADIQVQFFGGNATDWFSLSNGSNFNFTGLNRGSAQMAVTNGGNSSGPMAQNVRAVKFVASNANTWFRELVVTGVPSAPPTSTLPAAPSTPVAGLDAVTPGAIDVSFNTNGPAQSFLVQRAVVTNSVVGTFTTIASRTSNSVASVGFSLVDTNTAANTTYVYQVVAQATAGAVTSGISNPVTTPPVSAEAHFYNMSYWEGPAVVNQGIASLQLSYSGGSPATGIRTTSNSAIITGKITPTLSGTYTLFSNTDDDGYLYLDGVLVSSDPGGHGTRLAGSTSNSVTGLQIGFAKPVFLTSGTSYDFVLLEHQGGGGAGVNLDWITPSSTQVQTVPSLSASNSSVRIVSPISDAPVAPTNLTVTGTASNYVNFTFTAENNAVVHYILQRAIAGTSNWATINQIDPASDVFTGTPGVTDLATARSQPTVAIQDASPIQGVSYIYRVAAVNFDGVAATPIVSATLASIPDLVSPPAGALTFTTAADTGGLGLAAGTYFLKYSWISSAGGNTAASAETSFVVNNATGTDLNVTLPAAPTGASSANVYISNATGKELLVGSAASGQSLTIRGLPYSSATSAPTATSAGLAAGTYYVAYTWAGNETTVTGETSYGTVDPVSGLPLSNETKIVLTGTTVLNDIQVSGFPTAPAGVANVNIYIGTSSGGERFAGSVTASATASLVIRALPLSSARAIPSVLVNGTAPLSNITGPVGVIPAATGSNPAGVEIHEYNMELFRRTSLSQVVEASAVAQNGLATDYIPQVSIQTDAGGVYTGPIDRSYNNSSTASSPDGVLFPDLPRVHSQSFAQAFTGTITPTVTGTYTIISNTADDGFVWIDGTLVSADPGTHGQQDTLFPSLTNNPIGQSRTQDTLVPVYLVAGTSYDLTMFMGNQENNNPGAHLKWVEPFANNALQVGQVTAATNANVNGALLDITNNNGSNGNGSFISSTYNGYTVFITAGPGAGQAGIISNYSSTTAGKTFNVSVLTNGNQSLWTTVPTSASRFMIAWVAPVPLRGDDQSVNGGGGLSLRQDVPTQSAANLAVGVGSHTATTAASAAQNLTISQISPTAGVSLSWTDSSVSELWYEVQRSTTGVLDSSFVTIGTTPMNVGTTFTDPSAANSFGSSTISYFYRVRGVNFDGAGPFAPVVNTFNGINVPAAQIANIIQGAPGTAGIVFSNGSPNAGGLDLQYATLTGTTTGTFIDATPLGLPSATLDYQVTGLTPGQKYLFQARNLPGGNYVNSTLFGTLIAFTPAVGGGVQESFGTPGLIGTTGPSLNGSFVGATGTNTTIGDLLVNPNASFTGAGILAPATPGSAPATTTPSDLANPTAPATVGLVADVPAPTLAGTFNTGPQNTALSNVASVYIEYTWATATAETLPSPQLSFSIPVGFGRSLTYSIPAAPSGFGITNANIYIGSSPTAELFYGAQTPGTNAFITTFATSGQAAPVVSGTGVPAGTYYLSYTWTNAANQQTAGSTEQTITAANPSNDLSITLPAAPAGAVNSNVYIGSSPGGERLVGTAGIGGAAFTIKSLPPTTAAAVPTTSAAGLAAGTYFVQYTWSSTLPNENTTTEGLASPLTSVVLTAGQDLSIAIPAAPNTGSGNANVYIGTSPATLFASGVTTPSTTYVARTLPTGGNRPPVPGTVTALAATATTADSNGIAAGSYYVAYTWTSGTGLETAGSPDQLVVLSAKGDITVTPPSASAPAGYSGSRIYLGTAPGQEFFSNTAGNTAGASLVIKTLPTINNRIVPLYNSQAYRLTTPSNALELVSNDVNQVGNAFNLGENIAGFTTSFDWVMESNGRDDGFGIVFTPDSRTFTGAGTGSYGYTGTTPSMKGSAGIFFDLNSSNGTGRTGLATNGNLPGTWLDMSTIPGSPTALTGVTPTNSNIPDRRVGDVFSTTISYNNTTHIITENVVDTTLKNRGVTSAAAGFTTSYSIDLVATIGMPAAYVGFVASNGSGGQSEKDILNWSFSNVTTIASNTINGTSGPDQITLTQDPDGVNIDWTLNGGTQIFTTPIASAASGGLTINGLGGNDVITLNYGAGNKNPLPNKLNLDSSTGKFAVNGLATTGNPLAGTTLDIKKSTVFLSYGAPASDAAAMANVLSYLKTGYNSGAWTGTSASGSILSSAAAANANQTTAIGYADSSDGSGVNTTPNTIELKYTLYADTALAGTVGFNDFAKLGQTYGNNTGGTWNTGDWNYDGSVNFLDFNLLGRTYGTPLGSQSAAPAAAPAATPAAKSSAANSTNSSLATSQNSVTITPTVTTGGSDSSTTKKKAAKASVKVTTKAAASKTSKKSGK